MFSVHYAKPSRRDAIIDMKRLLAGGPSPGIVNRWFRHLIAGGAGTLLYVGLVTVFVEIAGLHPVPSVVIAFLLMEIYAYVIFRVWVYAPKHGHAYALPRFLTVTVIALSLNTGIMYAIVEMLELWYFWGLIATTLVVPPTNFLLNYFWAFK
jgi:putative flippase GtrA